MPAPTTPSVAGSEQSPAALAEQIFRADVRAARTAKLQTDRDEAARRVVARGDTASRNELLAMLKEPVPQANAASTPLAAARALADPTTLQREFVEPLSDLLRSDRTHAEAAAAALINYHDQDLRRLIEFLSSNQPETLSARVAAVRAAGGSADKRMAQLLVGLVTDTRDPQPPTAAAAADALTEMTLLQENGRDRVAWQRWWDGVRQQSPEQFRADILDRQRRRRASPGQTEVENTLLKVYDPADPKFGEVVRQLLNSSDVSLRTGGVRLCYRIWLRTGKLPPGTDTRLRDLVRDGSAFVRQEAARTLGNVNDKLSLSALLAQLAVEPDAAARASIAQSLKSVSRSQDRMVDPRALTMLIDLLQDKSLRVAITAADSLGELGTYLGSDAAGRRKLIDGLKSAIQRRAREDPTGELKGACVDALRPLKEKSEAGFFLSLLDPRETVRVRVAALGGLEEIGDKNAADAVVNYLRSLPTQGDAGTREAPVRLAAISALKGVGSFAQHDLLYSYATRPQIEPDPNNQKVAWDTFVRLLPGASISTLNQYLDTLNASSDHEHRVIVGKEMLKKQLADNNLSGAADTRLQIGESLMRVNRPDEATTYLADALEHWRQSNPAENAASLNNAATALLDAQLAARQYPQAVKLVSDLIQSNRTNTQEYLGKLTTKAESLVAQRPREAEQLADLLLKLPIANAQRTRLEDVKRSALRTP